MFQYCRFAMASSGTVHIPAANQDTSIILNEFKLARHEKTLWDFKIRIGNDFLFCNKLILASRSPYMKAMLTSGMVEESKQEVQLHNITLDIMNVILDYMCYLDVNFHNDQLMNIIAAADYLQMTELKEICYDELQAFLKPTNVISLWKEANLLGINDAIGHCEEMMASHFAVVSAQPDFLALSSAQVELYASEICNDRTQTDELLEAAMRWIIHDVENRQSYLDDILHHLDLGRCSAKCKQLMMKTYPSILDQQCLENNFQKKTTLLDDLVTEKRPVTARHDLCIVGGCYHNRNHEVNPVIWKINKSQMIEKLCDISYEGFASGHSVCKTPDGFVITGGQSSVSCMMYISATQSWRRMPDMPVMRGGHDSICVNQTIYVFGGSIPGTRPTFSRSVHMLSINESTWQKGPNLPFKIHPLISTELLGSVYILDESSNQLLHLDVDRKIWSLRAPLPWKYPHAHVYGVSMTSARGRLYVAGGFHRMCAWYRPCTDTWCYVEEPIRIHRYGTLVNYNDKLILLGGDFIEGTQEVEEYSFEDGTWSLCNYRVPSGLIDHYGVVLSIPNSDEEPA